MTKTFEVIHQNTKSLEYISRHLADLAWAFSTTGNTIVADKLSTMSDSIHKLGDEIFKAYNEETCVRADQSLANSQRFIGAVFTSLLDGEDPEKAGLKGAMHHLDTDLIDEFNSK